MSNRPITRSKNNKNKKQRIDDNAEATSQILRKINSTGQVTEDDVNQLNMTWKPVCQGCRQNTKDNPNCFCGLIPPATGSRKSGLWQKMSEIVHSLGPDPSKDLRSCPDSPAGLTNLGATCYANSILQCLYMNKSFREGVFSVEPEVLEEQPVLNKLARLFAQLHASKMAFVDSAPFIETLELDNGIQQDSHEFLTLLFSLLERCLSCSKVFKARTVVQDLFRGGVSHVTRCSKCGNNSEASSKIEDFYGLELNVKGLKSLDESLDDCFSIEELQGDNQYYCESCATRVNATRSIKLRSLPPVLNFQLRRCIFLPNTTTKKKITSAFCFPGELNMSHRLSENRQSDLIYDLSAVLIHKGSAVNSGHYVAHIKDENTQQWWEFDDEHVSNLGQNPFGESSSDAAAKPVQTEAIVHSPCPEALDVAVNGNVEVGRSQCPDSSVSNGFFHVQTFSSSDAYLLMYVLRHPKNGSAEAPRDFLENKKMGNGDMIFSLCEASLPSHLCEEVKKLNQSYLESCENYRSKKELAVNQIVGQRQEIRSILNEAPVQSIEEPYYWISADWLRHWADNVSPFAINNAPILCIHGKVPITAVGRIKRLSVKAWTMLFSKYGGGPIVGKVDYCVDCLVEKACTMVRADSYRDKRTAMKELAEAALAGNFPDDALYYISRSWLQQWLRRKNTDSPCEADAGPTVSIRCPHGELMPEQAAGARRLLVPEKLWNFLYETANSVKPDDPLGCSVFLLGSEPCAQCSVELTEVASLEDNLREFKLKQRQSHERLASGKNLVLDAHSRYYLMPSTWLSTWKNYISASGKSAAASAQPETLNSVFDFLKCEQHSKLLERPPHILWKRGVIQQKGPTMDGLTIVTESDWKLFCEDWGGTEMEGISAEIELVDNLTGSCEQMPICEENMDRHGELNGESEMKRLVIRTSPEVCEHCIGERESCELMRKLNYQNEEICVCFIRGKEPPKSILEASACTLESNRRISKRSRKAAFGNSINLNVSGSTSIYQLKMMIWESFGVVKENQVLHKGSKVIDRESATLADLNIFPGDVLWVKDSEIHENRDIADEISDEKLEIQRVEEGFRGTLLTSNVSSQIVSEACFN